MEFAITPDPVLTHAPGGGKGEYDVTGFNPTWILVVKIQDGQLLGYHQTMFRADTHSDYTALSYDVESAAQLFDATERPQKAPAPDPPYSIADRQKIAKRFLQLYCSAYSPEGGSTRTEYIWLDEFCISDNILHDGRQIDAQRRVELGRTADIYRQASQVVVFCHEVECDHTTLTCPWGKRLWCFAEILHAKRVLQMTRVPWGNTLATRVTPYPGDRFREAMQTNAARGNKWHLCGSVTHDLLENC
ncbi:hypothetical protein B0H14DRAFT_2332477 [Mycena olivaceomarginata]|nr:hypothetical protein B0H14DRAFT_2332477 [Mycena olivaceomarginata]